MLCFEEKQLLLNVSMKKIRRMKGPEEWRMKELSIVICIDYAKRRCFAD